MVGGMHPYGSGDRVSEPAGIEALAEELIARPQALLEPFRKQDFAIRSLTVVDACPDQGRPLAARIHGIDQDNASSPRVPASRPNSAEAGADGREGLERLRRRAEETCGAAAGEDLLAAPAEILAEIMVSAGASISFRAVAAITTLEHALPEDTERTLRRGLFDDGLVCIGSVGLGRHKLTLFLASDAVRAKRYLHGGGGRITMSSLGSNGRFANQLFQYAFMKLYALRHDARMAVPDWQGRKLFELEDPDSAGIELPRLAFEGFSKQEHELWRSPSPPVEVDFEGYFQEIPSCWQRHRQLLRTLFELPAADRHALDAWRGEVTENGRRTLVAVHLRRTDYRVSILRWFRIIPEEWYLDWLKEIWPTLADPVLFVATDEPDTVLPQFAEFSPKSSVDLAGLSLPDHVRDFEVLRRADYLAICNSSFSRMAAILGPDAQRCFLPSIQERRIVPYEPWDHNEFWQRFGDAARDRQGSNISRHEAAHRDESAGSSLLVDVTDLLSHLRSHSTVSGIQRVQCELVRSLAGRRQPPLVNFTVFAETGLATVAKPDLLEIIERVRLGSMVSSTSKERIRAVLAGATPADVRPGDVLLLAGAFWSVGCTGGLIQQLKDKGLTVGFFVHDILPISRPEYFQANAGAALAKPLVEAVELADFLITSSNHNKEALAAYRSEQRLGPIPTHVVPLGHVLPKSSGGSPDAGADLAALIGSDFVLCVGTIETRKNPSYLLNIWKLMVDAGRDAIPTLVFAGRKGWLVEDFLEQLKACDYLDGRILLLHDLGDQALDLLYRHCLLTMFPSFEEGWGLPVGESLSHGKVCLASGAGGIPEVGGPFVDYLDPYNIRDGYARLTDYLDNPGKRVRREEQIASQFSPRSWQSCADGIVSAVKERMERPPATSAVAAISLPANEFLPIGSPVTGTAQRAAGGYLSADSACISGWGKPTAGGIPILGRMSVLRFRTAAPEGSNITVVFRLAGPGFGPGRLLIRPVRAPTSSVSVAPRSGRMAALSCQSGPGGLVAFQFERTHVGGLLPAKLRSWKLKGFLYISPADLDRTSSGPTTGTGIRPTGDADTAIRIGPSEAEYRDVGSRAAFLRIPDSKWRAANQATIHRHEPAFADAEDRRLFLSRYRNSRRARLGAVPDDITFRRLHGPYVSMSRFSEGSIFDRSGVVKDIGFLKAADRDAADLPANDRTGTWIREEALARAPRLDGTFAIFFNGNLHNYYHWIAEGMLALDVLAQTIGDDLDLRIVLPKTMDINAVFDHRASVAALGFGKWPVVEAAPPIVRVGEAVWVESSDFIEGVPAARVRSFQRRIASLYADRRGPRNRRLLVKRLGQARAIDNFADVEAFLQPLGFETVWLEGASVEEQIDMFQRAEFVIGAHGAGLTNLLFCEPGTKVIEFMPTAEMRPFFWLISEKLGLRHAMQFCPGVEGAGFQASIRVDMDKLRRLYELIERGH
jgi:capsular polysaccharide biosynthesis protein/glycosyltransferase involved in cell wall biosynthesis